MPAAETSKPTIWTIGHSTHPADAFVALLEDAGLCAVADVRRFPSSRRHPQFNGGELERTLVAAGIRYVWLGETLGGRRRASLPAERSPNAAWQVEAFRHYADAFYTDDFQRGLVQLEQLARELPTAFMCAERLWWQCHRRLLADLLTAAGWRVLHVMDRGKAVEHTLSEWARVDGGRLTYPALL